MSNSVVNLAATTVRNYGKNTFKLKPFENIYTCNTGQIIPAFGTIQINPGSTWKITTSILARLNTSRYPTIARGWVEYMWVYVPHMQIWEHWDEFMGENTESAWVSSTTYTVPQITITSAVQNGDLLDYFGVVPGLNNTSISALLLRAYNWACDQIARDQNIEAPFAPATGDSAITYVPGGSHTVGGLPYCINRKADYFSTCLPEPQKGPDVYLPLGTSAPITGTIPVMTENGRLAVASGYNGTAYGLQISQGTGANEHRTGITANGSSLTGTTGSGSYLGGTAFADATQSSSTAYANLTNANSADIITVRNAIVTQHIYERDARSGTRAPEMLYARWGVEVDPLEMGRPRILDMGRFPIDFEQVPQTSESTSTSEQGTLTAFGYTNNRSEEQTFSFKYAGSLLCLVAIRFEHKYQYGLRQEFIKTGRFQFWHPEFAGLGDQPVYDAEIYPTGGTTGNIATRSIFGYQIRGAEYLNYPSMICGQVRSNYATSLDYTHMADEYSATPVLGTTWMKESPANVDRTIFVPSTTTHQWLVDFVAEFEITDTLPAFAIPGIDRI